MKDMEVIPYKIPAFSSLITPDLDGKGQLFLILLNILNFFSGCLLGSNLPNLNKDKIWKQN